MGRKVARTAMKKSRLIILIISILIILLLTGGGWWAFQRQDAPVTKPNQTQTLKKAAPSPSRPLTKTALTQHADLRYSAIIYYAVKHLKIQRWQEVSNFELGWELEIYSQNGTAKYLVWPDKNIKSEGKQLQPNWFTIKHDQVTYDSFGVHTFQKDMTATVSLAKIIQQVNTDHAAKTIRQMPNNLKITDHRH